KQTAEMSGRVAHIALRDEAAGHTVIVVNEVRIAGSVNCNSPTNPPWFMSMTYRMLAAACINGHSASAATTSASLMRRFTFPPFIRARFRSRQRVDHFPRDAAQLYAPRLLLTTRNNRLVIRLQSATVRGTFGGTSRLSEHLRPA